MDKSKLAALGERLMTGGAQMSRKVSGKMKELLQVQTPESKMVDEATADSLPEPNWGINLRICSLLNAEELSGPEVMRAIKKKISGKNMVSQRFSLDLLEACAMNCEKVFSEIASEKVLEEMVILIENPRTHFSSKERALQLIQAWGESSDLGYLPVFRQTYLGQGLQHLQNLKTPGVQFSVQDAGNLGAVPDTDPGHHHLTLPEGYPNPSGDPHSPEEILLAYYHGLTFSAEEKKEALVVARNSIELISSMSDHQTESVTVKDELISGILEKCKQSYVVIQIIIESTGNDEALLFEALNLHEELQQTLSKFENTGETTHTEQQGIESPAGAISSTLDGSSTVNVESNDTISPPNSKESGTSKDEKYQSEK